MNSGLILYVAAPNFTFKRGAIPQLRKRFPDQWEDVWRSTCEWQSRLAPSRPRHSAAVNIMIRQMEWLCALYYALKDKGMSPEEAVALVEQVGLEVYRPVASDLFQFSRLRSAKRSTRVTWLLGLMTRYFFSSPFIHRPIPATGGYSFDVTRCPLANYFSDRGVPELTPHAACNLDYAAAGVFGVDLLRTQTIAGGADHCDFRWRFPDEAAG